VRISRRITQELTRERDQGSSREALRSGWLNKRLTILKRGRSPGGEDGVLLNREEENLQFFIHHRKKLLRDRRGDVEFNHFKKREQSRGRKSVRGSRKSVRCAYQSRQTEKTSRHSSGEDGFAILPNWFDLKQNGVSREMGGLSSARVDQDPFLSGTSGKELRGIFQARARKE